MKSFLASLATGILVTVGTFMTVVFARALFRDEVSVRLALWFFGWPIYFIYLLPGSTNIPIWLPFVVGVLLDIVVISFVVYIILKAIISRKRRARSSLPPQAPTF